MKGKADWHGQVVEQRQYNTKDFDRSMVLEKRTALLANRIWEYLKANGPMSKSIVFSGDQNQAKLLRLELLKIIPAVANGGRWHETQKANRHGLLDGLRH